MWHVNEDVVMWDLIVTIMWAVKVVVGFKYYGMDFPYLSIQKMGVAANGTYFPLLYFPFLLFLLLISITEGKKWNMYTFFVICIYNTHNKLGI